jgi:hypothetical protein
MALPRAQECLELIETANASAARSAQRENYMLDLMTDASQDMAGTLLMSQLFFIVIMCLSLYILLFFLYLT